MSKGERRRSRKAARKAAEVARAAERDFAALSGADQFMEAFRAHKAKGSPLERSTGRQGVR